MPNYLGRTLRSCQAAYHDMAATLSSSDYRPHQQLPAPIMYSGPQLAKKRPFPAPDATPPMGRLIQPRPPHPYSVDFMGAPAYAISPVGEPANKKKRGRPTKAEAQARADAAAARGEIYPPPRKGRPSGTPAEPLPPGESQRPETTPPGSASVPPMGSMTPQHMQVEQSPESSSGKKRPPPLELERPNREAGETESPLAYGSAPDQNRSHAYSSYTPISAPLPSATEPRDRDVRMEGVEESQPRTTTPRSFKDTVGI
jgi:hypothetical protein